jgi:hypothetical protein
MADNSRAFPYRRLIAAEPNGACRKRTAVAAVLLAAILFAPAGARGWDARTHRVIARLAIDGLSPSPLSDFFRTNSRSLQGDAVKPDTVLKRRYGQTERRRHYIDLEYFGPHPFSALDPSKTVMEGRYGAALLKRSGTLPWTIERVARQLREAWQADQCARVVLLAGYLAHYIGDASQPLHTTIHYDGYFADRGMHSRLERAADLDARELFNRARPQVSVAAIESVWSAVIPELRRAHALVGEVVSADRAARNQAPAGSPSFERTLIAEEGALFTRQVADAASVLASAWQLEWQRAGQPVCTERVPSDQNNNGRRYRRRYYLPNPLRWW